jgi:lysophospholipase L1-like esterase
VKNVLLPGDSIRLNYCGRVKELLDGECRVCYPEANCAYTLYTIWNLRFWVEDLKEDGIDVIYWNNGIWDHHRTLDDGEPLTGIEQYIALNRRLHRQLRVYTDKLIWATTTPAGKSYRPSNGNLGELSLDVWNSEIALYNNVLAAYFTSDGVMINDLNALIGSDTEQYLCEDSIHLSAAGIEAAANRVADCIRRAL